jgi:D-alanyl-D-alanine carboxypeptidase/D-alanyl-D-alanine-endopeptidase (penicillin-binding protein 4)
MPNVRVLALLFLAVASPVAAQGSLAARIQAVTNHGDYRQGRWGILIVDAASGNVIYEQNADKLFAPASVTKLYTCATALATFGASHQFRTPVYARGERAGGTLRGDLILVASGDFTLGGRTTKDGTMAFANSDHTYADARSTTHAVTDTNPLAGIEALAAQVAASGIKRVTGDILIDDRLFPSATGSGSGPSFLTPIIVNDNVVDVLITPAAETGKPATVSLRPATALIQADIDVQTVEAKAAPFVEVSHAGDQRFTVRGRVPAGGKPVVRIWPMDEPKRFARAFFIEALRRAGVTVDASALRSPSAELPASDAYAKLTKAAQFDSPPLSEAIKVTLKVSHNLYASTIPLLVAAKDGKGTIADGLRGQRRLMQELGVPVGTISFGGGAGGNNADATTPRATVQLILAMKKHPEYKVWHAGFPVLGVDGTLADVVAADSPAKGKVQAKTGTLYWNDAMNGRTLLRSKALAGTLTTANGRELAFTIFVNDVPLPAGVGPTREGKMIGRLCEIIHQYTP